MNGNKQGRCRSLRSETAALAAALAFLSGVLPSAYAQSSGALTEQHDSSVAIEKVSPWLSTNLHTTTNNGFIVVLKEKADLRDATLRIERPDRQRFVHGKLRMAAEKGQQQIRQWLDSQGIAYQPFYTVNMLLVYGGPELVPVIAARPDVLRVEGNPTVRGIEPVPHETARSTLPGAREAPAAPDSVEWGIEKVRAPEVWAMNILGAGIVIAGSDTGVQWDHPALKDHYRGWNGSQADHTYNWHDAVHGSGTNPCGYSTQAPCDDDGHGTHTIGTVVGDDGGTNQIGMAPGAQWIACRNMDGGIGTPARYIECFDFFLAPYPVGADPSAGDPAKAPHIINNSWGCPANEGCGYDTLRAAVESLRAAGIAVVAAAGNSGSSCSTIADTPAIYEASFTVGATASADTIASFSSRGPVTVDGSNRLKPDIAAPGVGIRSAFLNNEYASMSGTSMAAPHVAGAVALLWSGVPDLRGNIGATESLLKGTARTSLPLNYQTCGGIPGTQLPNNTCGAGRLDIYNTVQQALFPTLHVSRDGSGSGKVTSDPPGIDCGLVCSAGCTRGDMVTLTAAPAAGSIFTGWSGDCTGAAACSAEMTAKKNITAVFTKNPPPDAANTSHDATTSTTTIPNGGKCPARQALQMERSGIVNLYHKFRDQRLAKNEAGKNITALYYRHSGEVSHVLSKRKELREEARGLLLGCAQDIFFSMYKNKELRFTAAQYAGIHNFLYRLGKSASPELQADLARLLDRLADGSLQKELGSTVYESGAPSPCFPPFLSLQRISEP
jgi:serine protease AprX